MKQLLKLAIILPFLSFAQERSVPIHVRLIGMADGSLFYLNKNKQNVDSAVSKAETLEFSYVKKSVGPEGILVISRDRKQGYLIWVEDVPLTLQGIFGNTSPLTGEGSMSQSDFNEYMQLTQELEKTVSDTKLLLQKAKFNKSGDSATIKITLDELRESLKTKNKEFILSHHTSIISTYLLLLETTRKSFSTEEAMVLFRKLGYEQQNSFYGQSILKSLQIFHDPKIGGEAPSFSMMDVNGKSVSLSDYKNKNIVLVFWASWCVPCRKEIPEIKKAIEDFKGKNFLFIAVSQDQNKDAWLKVIQSENISWINISDLNGWINEAALTYGVTAIPDHFLIDSSGKIVERSGKFSVIRDKMNKLSLSQ